MLYVAACKGGPKALVDRLVHAQKDVDWYQFAMSGSIVYCILVPLYQTTTTLVPRYQSARFRREGFRSPDHGVHIRGINTSTIDRLKQYCIKMYGTYHGKQGEVIARALEEFLASKQHQTTFSTGSSTDLRADVRARVDRIREDLVLYMSDSENETGQIPYMDLVRIVKIVVGDPRTVRKYVSRILPERKLIEQLNSRVVQVSPEWIPTKVVVQQ